MSGGNEGEGNDTLEEEFKFYFSFTKPLVLDLPTEEDRALAAAWVQKLEAEPTTVREKQERLKYLKLLLFILQRGRLSGIFARQPPSGPLQPFPQEFTVLDMGNIMLEQDEDLFYGAGDAGRLPYVMELSNDMREYVASQEVPNFGVQMYYAWSAEEPVHKWFMFDEDKFPQYILEKIRQIKEAKTFKKGGEPKTGCKISLPDLCSAKSVKSPEEIETAQGRNFLTFMGLVGRDGSYNDKCDGDPLRTPRQTPQKKCPPRKKKCANQGVDDGNEEELDSFGGACLGGEMNSMNRPCFCTNQAGFTPAAPKKRPQSACTDNRMMASPSDFDNTQWSIPPPKSPGSSRRREPCFDSMPQMPPMTPMRNSSPRSNSLSRRNLECTPEDNQGGFQNQAGVCACTNPPCTCPCPRSPHKSPSPKSPGGRVSQSPSRTCTRAPRQEGGECNVNRNRGLGTHLTSFTAPDPCTPSPHPDMTPTGGRTGQGTASLRPVVHCYDNQNIDPALTKTIEKNDNWLPLPGGGVKYLDTDFKMACVRDQMIAKALENKCVLNAQRRLFGSPEPGPSGLNRMRPQSDYSQQDSSPLASHPICDHSFQDSLEDADYPQGQFSQTFSDYQGGASDMYPSCPPKINTATQKKSQPQSACQRNKNATPSVFAIGNDPNAGRLANMCNALRGMKQKTEAHREKFGDARSPKMGETCCAGGNQDQNQLKSFSRQVDQRVKTGGPGSGGSEQMNRKCRGGYQPPPPSPQQCKSYPNRSFGNFGPTFQDRSIPGSVLPPEAYDFTEYKSLAYPSPQDECEPCYEEDEEDEGDSSGSMEEQCQNRKEESKYIVSGACKEALDRRNQDYYKLNWEESNSESQGRRKGTNFAKHVQETKREAPRFNLNLCEGPYTPVPVAPAEFLGTMMSANDSYGPQWISPRGRPNTSAERSPRIDQERNFGTPRICPGPQRASPLTESDGENLTFEDTFRTNQPLGNRYFERSLIARVYPEETHHPVCSTPLRHHREGFKGPEDVSGINR